MNLLVTAGIREASNPCLFLSLWKKSVGYAINSKVSGFFGFSYLAADLQCRVKKNTFGRLDNLVQMG